MHLVNFIVNKKVISFIFIILIFAKGVHSSSPFSGRTYGYRNSRPYLYYPCTENINLENKDSLEFRWKPTQSFVQGYDFKLYKGYQMVDDNLIIHEKIKESVRSLSVPTELLSQGNVYSWSLVERDMRGLKSEDSFCSFEVERKSER
jgi:hypothetical protein